MVKKNLLNLAALILGFGFVITQSAFTLAPKTGDKYLFHYTGPSAMTEGQVESRSNWTYEPTASCPTGDDAPCGILIDEAYVDNPGPGASLKVSAAINASDLGSGKAIVVGSGDATAQYLNTEF